MKTAENEWYLRASAQDEQIVGMVGVEQKYVFAMMVDGCVKRLADNDLLEFNEIGFRNRFECVIHPPSFLYHITVFLYVFREAKQMIELHPLADHLAVTTNFDEILIVCTKSGKMV